MTKQSVQELINKYSLMFKEVNTNWNVSRENEYNALESILADLVILRDSIEDNSEYELSYINSQY